MSKFKMHGVVPPMLTPFDKNGALDEAGLQSHVQYLSKQVHGVFICGSYGSGPLMSVEERKKVAEITVANRGNLQVVDMIGCANTQDSIELAKHAKEIGCDAVSAVCPYYFHHNMDDVFTFFMDIKEAIGDFPLYMYLNPKFSGYPVDNKTIQRLKDAGLNGIKAASFDLLDFAGYMKTFADENFDVVLGTEALWLPASVYEAKAFIPGLANAFPEMCVQMFEESQRGDYEACLKTQYLINEMRNVMYTAKSTQLAVYAMLEIRGLLTCYPRKPFNAATQEQKDAMKQQLLQLGVL